MRRMLRGIFGRITYSNVVASLALFLALGGVALAAKPLLTGADIQDDSITGADVAEATLAKVPDADRLDGKDSREFVHIGGLVTASGTAATGVGSSGYTV